MRREERVTVQGPVKEQQPDGMSHRGGGGLPYHPPRRAIFFPPCLSRSSALWSPHANRTVLLLAGEWNAQWQLTALALPLPSPPAPLHTPLAPQLRPHCAGPTTPCRALGGVVVGAGALFMALEHDRDLVVAKVDLRDWSVVLTAPLGSLRYGRCIPRIV